MHIDSFITAEGAVIPSDVSAVHVLGYYEPNDGGDGLYVEHDVEPLHAAKFQADDFRWFGLAPDQEFRAEQFGAKGDGTTDDAAAIQAAIDAVGTVSLGARTYVIGEALVIPSDRTLVGQGPDVTYIKRLPYALDASGPHHGIVSNADNVTLCGFTYNGNRAGDEGVPEDRCHGIVLTGTNCQCADIHLENVTAYACWAVSDGAPVSVSYDRVRMWNCHVGFEQVGDIEHITITDCAADASPRDEGTTVSLGVEALIHQYDGASNITITRFVGRGATTGLLAVCNSADLTNISLVDCVFDMTGSGNGIICRPEESNYMLYDFHMIGCRVRAPDPQSGSVASFRNTVGSVIGCDFEGKGVAVFVGDGAVMKFTACRTRAEADSPNFAFGIKVEGTGVADWNGGLLAAEGAVGKEVPYQGAVRVSGMTQLVKVTANTSEYAPLIGPMVGGYISGLTSLTFASGTFASLTSNGTARMYADTNNGASFGGRGVNNDLQLHGRTGATIMTVPAATNTARFWGALEFNTLPPTHADNAAAAAGGVPVGRFYVTSTGQAMIRR